MKILHVVGARPNFMKVAPVMKALASRDRIRQTLVHTGQHYDASMSDVFFQQLGMPQPNVNLEVGSSSHAVQTAQIMSRLEPVLLEKKPDLVLVYGDVNSTVAAAIVCAKLLIPVGHVEAGLRSFDRTMPEEINRLITDQISELLFIPSDDANENLLQEGIDDKKIYFVGNVMIDTLVQLLPLAQNSALLGELSLKNRPYGLVTLHRPSNVDESDALASVIKGLYSISQDVPLVFPVHPRTRQRMTEKKIISGNGSLHLLEPLSYLEFLALQREACLVITDSGGIQEETTYLGIPCLTLRENTERPITVSMGTNIIVGRDMKRLTTEVKRILKGDKKQIKIPPLWDGHAAQRIADIVINLAGLI